MSISYGRNFSIFICCDIFFEGLARLPFQMEEMKKLWLMKIFKMFGLISYFLTNNSSSKNKPFDKYIRFSMKINIKTPIDLVQTLNAMQFMVRWTFLTVVSTYTKTKNLIYNGSCINFHRKIPHRIIQQFYFWRKWT